VLSRDGPKPEHWDSLPTPTDAQNARDGQALEDFLDWAIWPKLKRKSNTAERNPWKSEIEASIRRNLTAPPAEGRPSREGWTHQRC